MKSLLCIDCATPIPPQRGFDAISCPECGSTDLSTDGFTRPGPKPPRPALKLKFPLDRISLKQGGTLLMSGDRGSGKTTTWLTQLVQSGVNRAHFFTSEQEPEEVAQTYYRVNGQDAPRPRIYQCRSWDAADKHLTGIEEDDLVVIDSVSEFGSTDEVMQVAYRLVERTRKSRARLVLIGQFVKDGTFKGANALPHLVDVVVEIPNDTRTGMRQIVVKKDRGGTSKGRYFRLGPHGPEEERLPYAYSVEGSAGNYWLHLYPFPGAKLAGPLSELERAGVCGLEGHACAGIASSVYKTGFAEPSDVESRRRYAEENGLKWLTLETFNTLKSEAFAQDQHPGF